MLGYTAVVLRAQGLPATGTMIDSAYLQMVHAHPLFAMTGYSAMLESKGHHQAFDSIGMAHYPVSPP